MVTTRSQHRNAERIRVENNNDVQRHNTVRILISRTVVHRPIHMYFGQESTRNRRPYHGKMVSFSIEDNNKS